MQRKLTSCHFVLANTKNSRPENMLKEYGLINRGSTRQKTLTKLKDHADHQFTLKQVPFTRASAEYGLILENLASPKINHHADRL